MVQNSQNGWEASPITEASKSSTRRSRSSQDSLPMCWCTVAHHQRPLVVTLSLVGRELPEREAVLERHTQHLGERDPVLGAVLRADVAQLERAGQQPVRPVLLNHVHRQCRPESPVRPEGTPDDHRGSEETPGPRRVQPDRTPDTDRFGRIGQASCPQAGHRELQEDLFIQEKTYREGRKNRV